ncbi:hypothetical protein DPMN_052149 [Dreissena polymorpha]|uniref:Uncharacterized protein n=1 Tax=Dreissena polymorpha TaxID=45954 RepID=A0A9D4CLD9_DREPO|nr:hypothetical protein DPMN_052149 [Dreissena polymorpha]
MQAVSDWDREVDGGCGRRSIRQRRMDKRPDGVEGLRRKPPDPVPGPEPEAATAAAPIANFRSTDDSATNTELLIPVVFSTQPMGFHSRGLPNLNLPGGARVVKMGVCGMWWADAVHKMKIPALFRMPPGGTDLVLLNL